MPDVLKIENSNESTCVIIHWVATLLWPFHSFQQIGYGGRLLLLEDYISNEKEDLVHQIIISFFGNRLQEGRSWFGGLLMRDDCRNLEPGKSISKPLHLWEFLRAVVVEVFKDWTVKQETYQVHLAVTTDWCKLVRGRRVSRLCKLKHCCRLHITR